MSCSRENLTFTPYLIIHEGCAHVITVQCAVSNANAVRVFLVSEAGARSSYFYSLTIFQDYTCVKVKQKDCITSFVVTPVIRC